MYGFFFFFFTRGLLNFGLDRSVPLGILECHPYKYQFVRKKDPSLYQIAQILGQIYTKITIFRENLRHFGANFGKFWKVGPSKYQICVILAQILENFGK